MGLGYLPQQGQTITVFGEVVVRGYCPLIVALPTIVTFVRCIVGWGHVVGATGVRSTGYAAVRVAVVSPFGRSPSSFSTAAASTAVITWEKTKYEKKKKMRGVFLILGGTSLRTGP